MEDIKRLIANNMSIRKFFTLETSNKKIIGLPVTRIANSNKDFELVYQRERAKLPDSNEDIFTMLQEKILLPKRNMHAEFLNITPRNGGELLTTIDRYLDYIKNRDIDCKQTTNKKLVKTQFTSKSFAELFINPELIESCLNLLKETDKPCINDANEYLRNKGAFVVWFNAMERKKMFNQSFSSDNERAAILNHNFPELNISASLFRQENVRATNDYKKHFEAEITAIKH